MLTTIFPMLWGIALTMLSYSPLHMVTMYSQVVNPLVMDWEMQDIAGKGITSLIYYPANLINILGPLILVLFLIGLILNVKNREYVPMYFILASYLLFHSCILAFPYFGSVGFLRYISPIIPIMSVFAVSGLKKLAAAFSVIKQRLKITKLSDDKVEKVAASIIVFVITLTALFVVTPASENQKIIQMTTPEYNAIQHTTGSYLTSEYPRNTPIFCPANLFSLQMYVDLPILYFPKESYLETNYTIMKLDGDFELTSFDIYEDCPLGHLVVWTNDAMYRGSEFSPERINGTIYMKVFEIQRGFYTIIVYERI